MEASPPTMMAKSSDFVMRGMYGFTTRGASVWPTKMLAQAESDSARLVPRALRRAPPRVFTTICMMPRW